MFCPICLSNLAPSNEFKYIDNYESHDGKFILRECSHCNVQFWTPFKNPGSDWYKNCEQNLRHRSIPNREYFLWVARNRRITRYFLNNPPHKYTQGLKLLDVACGTGGFLLEARKLGYDVSGVDFDSEQIEFAQEFGLTNVYIEDVLSFLGKYHEEFDVITGFEIIEHLDRPRKFLDLIFTALKPGGFMCLSTPNRSRIGPKNEFWDFPHHHLTRWSKDSLRNFVASFGFKVVSVKEEMPTTYLISRFVTGTGLGTMLRRFISKIKSSRNVQYFGRKEKGDTENTVNDSIAKIGFIKDKVIESMSLPISYALFLGGIKGEGIYLTAKK